MDDIGIARLGIKRFPALTVSVLVVTAITSLIAVESVPALDSMQRTPDALGAQWWRNATALFAQDGGIAGTVFNLLFLLVIGTIAEQVVSRVEWLFLYFIGGMLAELMAHFWQPYGAGNSIAICAITGPIAIALFHKDPALPRFSPVLVWYWLAGLLATLWWPLLLAGVAAALAAQLMIVKDESPNRLTAVAVGAVGIVLSVFHNIHGAALLIGLLFATLIAGATPRYGRFR